MDYYFKGCRVTWASLSKDNSYMVGTLDLILKSTLVSLSGTGKGHCNIFMCQDEQR